MSTPQPEYTWISRTHVTKWVAAQQAAVDGWELRVTWNPTGTVLDLFVPDQAYNPTNVDSIIRQAGYLENDMQKLGGTGG